MLRVPGSDNSPCCYRMASGCGGWLVAVGMVDGAGCRLVAVGMIDNDHGHKRQDP